MCKSIIRLSEAIAKMYCQEEIDIKHVQEAYRLLSKAIIHVDQPDIDLNEYNRPGKDAAPTDEPMEEDQEVCYYPTCLIHTMKDCIDFCCHDIRKILMTFSDIIFSNKRCFCAFS